MNSDELANLLENARRLFGAGNWNEAEQAYRRALALAPDAGAIQHELAALHFQSGRRELAIDEMTALAVANPEHPGLLCDLGSMLSSAGRNAEAVSVLSKALALDPRRADARFNLGNCYRRLGQLESAVEAYQLAAEHDPADPDAQLNLGVTHQDLGRLDAARACFERAIELRPAAVEPWINLGLVAKAEGNYSRAVECYDRALVLDPGNALAHNNRGSALAAHGKLDEAIADYERALAIRPSYALALDNLAAANLDLGREADAVACLERAAANGAGDAFKLKAALAVAPIMQSLDQIHQTQSRIAERLARLEGETLSIADPLREVGSIGFYLAYQGGNLSDTQARIARILRRASPSLDFVAPHCLRPRRTIETHGRIRVGFASAQLYNHTIGKLNMGLIEKLDRKRFEVFVFRTPGHDDERSRRMAASADHAVTLSPQLTAARGEIGQCELDVLFYPDIGMTAITTFLAHARLAPVQCVTWGHPLTTGIPTVDYFVSSRELEPEGAEAHYTERLVRLAHLANYYYRPEPSAGAKTRADFGLDADSHLYLCPQSLFKLHPHDDAVWREILARDPAARIVLVEGSQPAWCDALRRRHRQSLGPLAERVQFVPRQPTKDFVRLLALADVIVDPLEFGGGNTSYEAFASGTPIVTLPGGFLRSRITYALYRAMGLDDCVATSEADYVDRAVRLGTDPAWRETVCRRILAASDDIFENEAGVRELGEFFVTAVGNI